MVATLGWGHKADIRQIVGRDQVGGRKSATRFGAWEGTCKAKTLMSKGLQGFSAKWHGVCDKDDSAGCTYRPRKQQIPPVQEGSQFKCRGQWRIFATRDD